ncbi:MAG: apolipoprotein N-acyltransferase [Verrucomicrobiales bacterium]
MQITSFRDRLTSAVQQGRPSRPPKLSLAIGMAVISAVLVAATLPPLALEGFIWVGLVPLFLTVWRKSPGRRAMAKAFMLGWVWGLTFFLLTLHWLGNVTWLGTVAVCMYLALYPAIGTWLVAMVNPWKRSDRPFRGSRVNLLIALFCAAVWLSQEWLRSTIFSGFPWNTLGVGLASSPIMIQAADSIGALGLSFPLVFINVIIALSLRRFHEEAKIGKIRAHFDATLTVALLATWFFYGIHTLGQQDDEKVTMSVALVQPNTSLEERRSPKPEDQQALLEHLKRLSEVAATQNPDLMVWPESAAPGGFLVHRKIYDFHMEIAGLGDFDFVFGSFDADASGEYNAAGIINKNQDFQVYHKIRLVPFGEYVPFRESFPLFAAIVGDLLPEDFTPGRELTLFELSNALQAAPLICFEDTISGLARRFSREGAELLINMTNDAWFLQSIGSTQHLHNAMFRAVETRRPLIRAANTGVTAVIDPWGRTHIFESGGSTFIEGVFATQIEVSPNPAQTLYVLWGDWFVWVSLGLALVIGVGLKRRRLKDLDPQWEKPPGA